MEKYKLTIKLEDELKEFDPGISLGNYRKRMGDDLDFARKNEKVKSKFRIFPLDVAVQFLTEKLSSEEGESAAQIFADEYSSDRAIYGALAKEKNEDIVKRLEDGLVTYLESHRGFENVK